MRETRTSGSVGGLGGNPQVYPTTRSSPVRSDMQVTSPFDALVVLPLARKGIHHFGASVKPLRHKKTAHHLRDNSR